MRRLVFISLFSVALFAAYSGAVEARVSFNSEIFHPTPDNGPYITTSSTRTLDQWGWTVGTTMDFAHRPVELVGPAGGRVSGIVEDIFVIHFLGAVGFTDWFQVGMDVPFVPVDRTVNAGSGDINTSIQMSDLRLVTKFRLLNPDEHGWGIAILPFLVIPTGGGDRLAGNESWSGGATFAAETPDMGQRVRIALNLGYELRAATDLFGTPVDDWFQYSFALNIRATDIFEIIPEIWGQTLAKDFFSEFTSPLELGGEARVFFLDHTLALGVGGSGGLVAGLGSPVWRGFLRVSYHPLRRNVVVLPAPPPPPPPQELTPEDYYLLSKNCPPDPADWDPAVHDEACEKLYYLRQLHAQCPQPENFNPETDDLACEKIYVLQQYDRDGDGIPDYVDYCPDQPGPIENNGCPAENIVYLDWTEGVVKSDKILFEFNSATLTPHAEQIVSQIAEQLRMKLPYIASISVEGHTDNVGSAAYNLRLSDRRARSVMAALQANGIPGDKMRAVGYGLTRPIVSNQTEAGRDQNRRVEVHFVAIK